MKNIIIRSLATAVALLIAESLTSVVQAAVVTASVKDPLANFNYTLTTANLKLVSNLGNGILDPLDTGNTYQADRISGATDGILTYKAASGCLIDRVVFSQAFYIAGGYWAGQSNVLKDGTGAIIPSERIGFTNYDDWSWQTFASTSSSLNLSEVRLIVTGETAYPWATMFGTVELTVVPEPATLGLLALGGLLVLRRRRF
jgi:hypothetical protein